MFCFPNVSWAASNWLQVVNNGNLVYGPGITGLDAQLMAKLADLARLVGSRVRVHSGCRPGDRGWHGKCRAADFHVDGQRDFNVYQKAFANRRLFDRYQWVYHVPGRRACSTGEHNHLGRPDGNLNTFCHEKTCNWGAECSTIRVGKNETVPLTFQKSETCKNEIDFECWDNKN